MSTEHEHTLNVWLASHLKSYGLAAKQEVKKPGNRRLDVEVKIGPLSIAIEAEHGQSSAKKAAAIRDADARLKQNLAQCALAVCYPDDTTEESLPSAQLLWTVRDPAAPTPASAHWGSGDLEQLVSVIRLTPAQLGDPDSVAAALSSSLDGAVARLSEGQKRDLAKALDLPASTKRTKKKPWDPAAKRALLVIVTAVMFHARLDGHRHRLRPEYDSRTDPPKPFDDDWPPAMAQQCADSADPIQAFADAWNLILALDYKPIFETGRAALYSCPNDPAYTAAIRDSARAALAVARTIAGLRHDLLGRIFHTVLDTARYDGSQFSREEERKIKAREKALFANKPVHLSHNGGAFLYLADFLAKDGNGTVAAILPLVGATNYSTEEIRKYLAEQFHIETIVTSHDPERIYFSENTNIGEMLLICRRWPVDRGPKPPTRVINLAENPASPSAAISAAHAIKDGTVAAQGTGTVQEWPEEKIAAGDWSAVQFLSPYLCVTFAALKNGDLFPSISLGRISKIGPAGQRIRDAFVKSTMPDELGRVALWQHDTETTQSMAARADTHIIAKSGKAHLAKKYWQQRSTLFLPNRMRLNTVRTVSVRLDTPAIGSAWTPCRLIAGESGIETLEKAVCVYLNSSLGILALLGDRSNKTPSYPQFSLDDLRRLIVPDFTAIGKDATASLAATYDKYASNVLLPLPQIDHCPVRRGLDDAILEALDLDGEMVATIRRSLAAEPSVTGRRYSA